jgi:hypothetical protein
MPSDIGLRNEWINVVTKYINFFPSCCQKEVRVLFRPFEISVEGENKIGRRVFLKRKQCSDGGL